MAVKRTDKLNAEFQKNIYEILTKRVKDPRITEMFSVVKVDIDKELTVAKVYISVFGTNEKRNAETFEAIKSSAGFVKRELFKLMRIRTVPALTFIEDDNMEYSDRINRLLSEISSD